MKKQVQIKTLNNINFLAKEMDYLIKVKKRHGANNWHDFILDSVRCIETGMDKGKIKSIEMEDEE